MESKYQAWQTIYYHFRQFKLLEIWNQLHESIAISERERKQKNQTTILFVIDSQRVKRVQFVDSDIDGNKSSILGLPGGRKRTILVDTIGILWSIKVTSANISANQSGIQTLQ